jgi:SAM-dependent methyltransferase
MMAERTSRRVLLAALLAMASAGGLAACARFAGARQGPAAAQQDDRTPVGGTDFIASVPYVPTLPQVVDAMLSLAAVGPRDVVYDLGCGDGRIVIAAAKRFGARGLGVEIDGDLVARAQANAYWEGVADRARFALQDLFDLDMRPAIVVMMYLSVEMNLRLRPKLLAELKPGSRIVSNRFDMADVWRPERTLVVADTPIHLWRV